MTSNMRAAGSASSRVTLSEAKGLSAGGEMLHFVQHDSTDPEG
jgi:hypothetical protein